MPIYFDATFSWSGYSYQGKVGMFIVLKKLNEYDGDDIETNFNDWALEFEWLEDFSIKQGNTYQSLHQVKTLASTNINSYTNAIQQTLTNSNILGYHIPPHFHVSSNVLNPHNIFYSYTINNINQQFCPLNEIDNLLKKEIKDFLEIYNPADYNGNCEDTHFFKLLAIIDNHVCIRHQNIQNNPPGTRITEAISFTEIINSLKTNSGQFTNERMIYEKKEYLVRLVDEICQDINNDLQNKINIFTRDVLDLDDDSFVKFSKSISPHIKSLFDAHLTIEDFQNFLHRDHMIDVFFRIVQEIQKNGIFQEHKYLYDNQDKYLVTGISSSNGKRISKAILENPFAVEDLFEMDCFITENILVDSIELEAQNVNEIRDEELQIPERKEEKITELKRVKMINIIEAKRVLND
jgi:hypothetical protein